LSDDASLYAMPRNLVLAASAGTGKTHALVGVVLHLVIAARPGRGAPLDPSRVVATTFSRKAAAEIRARVVEELERLRSAPTSSTYLLGLQAALNDASAVSRRAAEALRRIDAARFGTLHSFATSLVRSYALELGIGARFDLAAEGDVRTRLEDALARAIDDFAETRPVEVDALVEAAGGIQRFVDQLRHALVQLEEDGRSPADLVVPPDDERILVARYEALLEHARALSGTPKFAEPARAVLDAAASGDATVFESAAVALFAVPATGRRTPDIDAFAVFRRECVGLTNEDKGQRFVRSFRSRALFAGAARAVRDILVAADAHLAATTRATASLGFGQILRAARELLCNRPDVAAEVGAGIDALLVDEFQDTSRVQRDLIQLLWAEAPARAAGAIPALAHLRRTGLLVVGDRKQSIYAFRGADVGVFAELAVGLAGAPAREALGIPPGVAWEPREPIADFRALRHNRRSNPTVLTFANAFSGCRFKPGDPPVELFEIAYVAATEDLLVPPERSDALVRDAVTWLRVSPRRGRSSTRLEEALVIADRVARLVREDAAHLRDIAVLATTNGMLDASAFALAQAGIPHVVAGKSFFRAREIRDLAAMLALVLDPTDRLAMLAVLRGPWCAVHDGPLIRPEDRATVEAVASVVSELASCARRLVPGTLLRQAVRSLRLEEVLAALPRAEQRVANVRKLLTIADRHTDAVHFRRWLDAAAREELPENEAATFSEDADAVRLLTVHASKGLAFPIVFLPEVGASVRRAERGAVRISTGSGDALNELTVRIADESGTALEPPSFARAHRLLQRRERAERQRLAYVAVTRAAQRMFFVGGRTADAALDPGSSTLGVLELLASRSDGGAGVGLAVEDVSPPAPVVRAAESAIRTADGPAPPRPPILPRWRALPIAPTALADFGHCGRRFELVHVLGLPERAHRTIGTERASGDARAEGTIAHAVLERVSRESFGGAAASDAVSRLLELEGVPPSHSRHDAIASRVIRFLSSRYAADVSSRGAGIRREVPFSLPIPDVRVGTVVLRGSIDLLVEWPDGDVDVVDYKSARSAVPAAHALQLQVYALAAGALVTGLRTLRAGLVFLGGGSSEPVWRTIRDEDEVRREITDLANRLVDARWSGRFPRVELSRCEAIHCGFIGRCHAAPPSNGTGENASFVTTT
jgi:ATP-dependent helicase/nuclease subunit A